jgi:hypothetical protein
MAGIPFIRPPDPEVDYSVGDEVEVRCDHESEGERVHDWLEGIIVQVDTKLVAVQFNQDVYLTDGWMVPDRILWFPHLSHDIRAIDDDLGIDF